MQDPAPLRFSIDIESLRDTIVEFVRHNQAWAPFLSAFLAFGESLAVLSLLFPATVLLVAIGDVVSYEFGRYFEDRVQNVWPLDRHRELVARGEDFTRRYGVGAIFLGKFFGPLRAFVPLAAGVFEMPRAVFQ